MKASRFLILLALCAVVFSSAYETAQAQPVLTFRRIVNNWPTIELYFTAACDGQVDKTITKDHFEVQEDGIPVPDFTVYCYPEPCPMSVALVLDASGSMSGAGNAGAKAAGNAFVEMMDGLLDEAAIVWFTSSVNVELGMTTNKTDLHDAVNSLPASGATAVWDGIFVGLQEVILSGSNQCRAVIALTDGNDNSSTRTPSEIIELANRNRIHVFTVGLGSVSPGQLETIALLTGGKYYQAPSASQLVAIYQEIAQIIQGAATDCLITYQAECPDGGLRTVDLKLKDFCRGGSDFRTRTYRAPKDTAAFTDLPISLGEGISSQGNEVAVPLTLDAAITQPTVLHPAVVHVTFDNNCMSFSRFEAPPGTLLNGVPYNVIPATGGIELSFEDKIIVQSGGLLGNLYFTPSTNPQDSAVCAVDLASWTFEAGCFKPVLEGGQVVVYNSQIPFVVVEGLTSLCEGDSVRLTAVPGFTDYLWSTGATTQSIWVSQPGTYFVTAKDGQGATQTSNEIAVTVLPVPTPGIYPSGTIAVCKNKPVTIIADDGYEEYYWITGERTQQITVLQPGNYTYLARSANGCWGRSAPLQIRTKGPEPVIAGPEVLCGEDSIITYSVPTGTADTYLWQVSGGHIVGPVDQSTVNIYVTSSTANLTLDVYDPITDCGVKATKQITRYTAPQRVNVSGGRILCEGDSALLWVEPMFESYEWSNGGTENRIRPTSTGLYFCKVTNGPCTFYTDTVRITTMEDIHMAITGDTVACQYSQATYSAPYIEGLTYAWRTVGESSDSRSGNPVTLQWGSGTSGKVVLTYGPAWCKDSVSFDVRLKTGTRPTVTALPSNVACVGDSVTLEAEPGYTEYQWSNGKTGRTIVVTVPGAYSVSAVDAGGCRGNSEFTSVSFIAKPQKPPLLVRGDTLICGSTGYVYEWYLNGTLIPGESGRSIIAATPGSYTVRIYDGGCFNESEPFVVVGIGRFAPGLAKDFGVSPNPSDGAFRVALEFNRPTAFRLQIVNVAGQEVYAQEVQQPAVSYRQTIHLGSAAPGVYFVMLQSGNAYDFRKVVVQAR